ncbi:hypothetical protein K469DRAFT_743806 [Zopfia rhizophila CBS 207.26]|uniref:Zn(2)-C6 fungal-type domain-containing protein n=1 Tax=Zopfia rhizophila CBS 207.26 TaxID=1314779 RepID=A0A6A6EUD0_9PEZI|nr:hypothetical protein K469DRAFT_743806 [Zopfia rhizophila CBS 207.26]
MPSRNSPPQRSQDRKRKTHTKSRRGCGNCKLRRVKCDEAKPGCKKCISYGVSCNYDTKASELDLSANGAFQVEFWQESEKLQSSPVCINQSMVTMIDDSLKAATLAALGNEKEWKFTEEDLEIVKRFQSRTVMTIGTSYSAPMYRDSITVLAFSHPFLMHMILSLTLLHDAHHASSSSSSLSFAYTTLSLHHWNTATAIFNNVLSQPIKPSSRDALWATAALIGALVFAFVESPDVEQAWPLRASDPHDLDWLKLSEGKKAIWQIAEPTREDSVFRLLAKERESNPVPGWIADNDLSGLSPELKALFNLRPDSTVHNNPYHLPVIILLRLQSFIPNHDNVLNFLYFMGYMTPEFRILLEIKDPRALLLLGWWFKRVEVCEIWWMRRRAQVEGKAIAVWLGRWFGGEKGLAETFSRIGGGSSGNGTVGEGKELGRGGMNPFTEWWHAGEVE